MQRYLVAVELDQAPMAGACIGSVGNTLRSPSTASATPAADLKGASTSSTSAANLATATLRSAQDYASLNNPSSHAATARAALDASYNALALGIA